MGNQYAELLSYIALLNSRGIERMITEAMDFIELKKYTDIQYSEAESDIQAVHELKTID